jgi:hypothetical protein
MDAFRPVSFCGGGSAGYGTLKRLAAGHRLLPTMLSAAKTACNAHQRS